VRRGRELACGAGQVCARRAQEQNVADGAGSAGVAQARMWSAQMWARGGACATVYAGVSSAGRWRTGAGERERAQDGGRPALVRGSGVDETRAGAGDVARACTTALGMEVHGGECVRAGELRRMSRRRWTQTPERHGWQCKSECERRQAGGANIRAVTQQKPVACVGVGRLEQSGPTGMSR
jgi:hypothetical protein